MIMDMKDNMQAFNPKIGKQRIQHYDVAKLGYVMCLTTKIETSRWTEFLHGHVEEMLQSKVLIAMSAAKINDGTGFKDDSVSKSSACRPKKKKGEHWGIHIETVKSHQVKVKRAMYYILAYKIPSWMHGMELRFTPHMKHDVDIRQKQRLRNATMKYKQVLANLVEFKLVEFEDIDSPISSLKNKTIRKIIMELETEGGNKMFIAIERSWHGDLTLWAKRKYKAEVEVFSTHMAAWLVKLHGDRIIAKLDPDMQKTVKTVVWREGVPLHPEEAEIEDASKIEIDG